MPTSLGPKVKVNSNLILSVDFTDRLSYAGEPTTNLSFNNGQTDSQYLASTITWVNAGSWTQNTNETDVPKPIIPGFDTTNYRINSGLNTTAGGSVHYGCGYTTVSPSTTYTVSVWYRQNRAGASQPYMRTNVTNISLGNLSYNGDTNSANWPVNQWIRISASGTTASNENAIYISNYIGSQVGDKIWYFGHQVEAKSHMTNLVAGTRSTTQGLYNLNRTSTVSLANAIFDANNNVLFDGVSSYVDLGVTSYGLGIIRTGTFMGWLMQTGGSSAYLVSDWNGVGITLRMNNPTSSDFYVYASNKRITVSYTFTQNVWYHMCGVMDDSLMYLYINGSLVGSASLAEDNGSSASTLKIGARGDGASISPQKTGNLQIYSSALNASEIKSCFNQQKSRFGY